MNFSCKFHKNKNGFTLIELIFTIIVVGLVFIIGGLVVSNILNSWYIVTTNKELLFNGRVAMNRMVREIRHATAIVDAKPTIFKFNAELPYKNTTKEVSIAYAKDGAKNLLNRIEDGTSYILANNLTNLHFEYFDANHHVTNDPNKIITIEIRLKLEHPEIDTKLDLNSSASVRYPLY